jgi:hypothetical protein
MASSSARTSSGLKTVGRRCGRLARLLDATARDAVEPPQEPCCPKCGGQRFVILELPPAETASVAGRDTS